MGLTVSEDIEALMVLDGIDLGSLTEVVHETRNEAKNEEGLNKLFVAKQLNVLGCCICR